MIYGISGTDKEEVSEIISQYITDIMIYDTNEPVIDIIDTLFGWTNKTPLARVIDMKMIDKAAVKLKYEHYELKRNASADIIDFLYMLPIKFSGIGSDGEYNITQSSAYDIFRHKILCEEDILGLIPYDVDIIISVESEKELQYVDHNGGAIIHVGKRAPTGIETMLVIDDHDDINLKLKEWLLGTI